MLLATDVAYEDLGGGATRARAAAVRFADWADETPVDSWTESIRGVAAYAPGRFYLRELPCIWPLVVEAHRRGPVRIVIVDGYVDLGPQRPGLGRHVHDRMRAQGMGAAVVGIAKTHFRGADAVPVRRGESRVPLWVGAAGLTADDAAAAVARMHGPHRVPTLLRRVDRLANGLEG